MFSVEGRFKIQVHDLLSITNLGSMTVHGGFGGGRGVRLNLRGSGNLLNDSNIFTIILRFYLKFFKFRRL